MFRKMFYWPKKPKAQKLVEPEPIVYEVVITQRWVKGQAKYAWHINRKIGPLIKVAWQINMLFDENVAAGICDTELEATTEGHAAVDKLRDLYGLLYSNKKTYVVDTNINVE
jgi:hypothetical protein